MAGLRGQLPHQQLLLPDGPGGAEPLEARRRQETEPAKGAFNFNLWCHDM